VTVIGQQFFVPSETDPRRQLDGSVAKKALLVERWSGQCAASETAVDVAKRNLFWFDCEPVTNVVYTNLKFLPVGSTAKRPLAGGSTANSRNVVCIKYAFNITYLRS
jgi:hypothetical protein